MELCGKVIKVRGSLVRIASLDGEGYDFLEDPEAALRALRTSGTRVDLLTFIQKLSETSPRYTYPMEWDNLAVLPVSTFDHWWKAQIGFKARNKAKQAEKRGVVIREVPFSDALICGICAIYNETPIRQGRRFGHYGKDFETEWRINATFPNRSIFIGAFFEAKLIGFAKLVTDKSGDQAGLMHIVSMVQHRDKAPTNALVAQAVRSCSGRGIRYLWYANFAYGRKQRSSLSDFKERNGFKRFNIPRYYVPLTGLGKLALCLGLNHSALDWVPEPAAAAYRELRRQWYAKRYPGFEKG